MDLVSSMLPGLGEDTKPHIPDELIEKADHIIEETKPYRRGVWHKLHKDYTE